MKAKILIVDDSGLSRRSMRRILETAGHEVVEAEDGITAIERYFLDKPDLVLTDLLMQGMSGLEVVEKLRELDAQVRVIVATADIQSSTRMLAKEAGAQELINKPFVPEVVLATVTTVLAGGANAID